MDNIKVGDRVKATNKNGDTAEFTVVLVRSTSPGYESKSNAYRETDGWTFEKTTPPLPTEPGLYQPKNSSLGIQSLRTFGLDRYGKWSEQTVSNITYTHEETLNNVKDFHETMGLARLVWEDDK